MGDKIKTNNPAGIFPASNPDFIAALREHIPDGTATGSETQVNSLLLRIYKNFLLDLDSVLAGDDPPKLRTATVIRNFFRETVFSVETAHKRLIFWLALKNTVYEQINVHASGRLKKELSGSASHILDRVLIEMTAVPQAVSKESRKDKELIRKLKIVKNDLQVRLNLMYQFIKSSPVGLAGCDDRMKVKFWNPMAVRMTGYEQSYIIDKNFDRVLSARSREVFRKKISQREHSRVRRLKLNIKTKTGGNFHSLISLNPITSGEPVPIRYVISFTDLSIEEIMQTQVRKIDQLSALARLADAIMHDIRNPISALALNIDIMTQILEEKNLTTAGMQKVLDKINRQIGELTRNLGQYVGYSGITELQMEPFDLNEVLDELILDTRVQGSQRNISLAYKKSRKELMIYGDWRQLVRAFRNLINNALEAVGKKGQIDIITRVSNGNIHFSVIDNGPGIPAENIHSIYQPYFTTKQNGTGLGLFIVREIVREHRGKIYCTSKSGYGTRFTISLPKLKKEIKAEEQFMSGDEINESN